MNVLFQIQCGHPPISPYCHDDDDVILKGNLGWARPMLVGPRIVRIVIEMRGLCGRGAPGLVMVPCIVDIDRIVIRELQFQKKMKGNHGWVWPRFAGPCGGKCGHGWSR
ncbi:hypothetical protein DPMN_140399 [Dreissena polymorpha]|uniref:Uncharacterized protein n=1 Tax=Dreissena polymorpha TaxID=45954 RepID=A0A9D4GBG8_DREPO|nr:hypothetical protein DPMN_140399 [Dreissena polymorpha]